MYKSNKRKQPVCFSLEVLFVPGLKKKQAVDRTIKRMEECRVWAVRTDLASDKNTHKKEVV